MDEEMNEGIKWMVGGGKGKENGKIEKKWKNGKWKIERMIK